MLRVGHFVTHPIQYFAPLYREIAKQNRMELKVLFGSDFGTKPSFDTGLGQAVEYDVPLLEGFQFQFLDNAGDGKPGANKRSFELPSTCQVASREQFDLLWIHGWGYRMQRQLARSAQRGGIPYLLRGESTLIEAPQYSFRWWRRKLLSWSIVRQAHGCFYVGKNNRRFFQSLGVPDNRLFAAHYSIDVDRFYAQSKGEQARIEVRKGVGTSLDKIVIITVAKLIARKRVSDVVQAVANLPRHCELWVLGDGDEREALRELGNAKLGERVRWLGFKNQSEIPAYLAASDIFVLASNEETWGLVVNEAMACGLPAVVSNKVGCAADLIIEHQTGATYDCGNIDALTQTLKHCVSNRDILENMGKAAQQLVQQSYSVQATATQIADAIEKFEIEKGLARFNGF